MPPRATTISSMNTPLKLSGALTIAILAGLSVAACKTTEATPPEVPIATSFRHDPADGRPVRRVVVPPFQDLSGFHAEAEAVRTSFIRALSQRQRFELLPLTDQELREVLPPATYERGVVSREALLAMSRRYRADGALFGVVTQYKPYGPFLVGLKVELASASTGEMIWEASGVYDASSRTVEQDVHNFHDVSLAATTSLEGWRLVLISPSRFIDYACSRLAATIDAPR